MKTGEVKDNNRWCESHNRFHGILYNCDEYSDELKEELTKSGEVYINNLRSRKWCDKQKEERGIDEIGINMFRVMAGIGIDDWVE